MTIVNLLAIIKEDSRRAIFNYNNIMQKIFEFLKEVKKEIKKINWPTREETTRYTLIVVGVSLGVAAFLGGFDYIFNILIKRFIFK